MAGLSQELRECYAGSLTHETRSRRVSYTLRAYGLNSQSGHEAPTTMQIRGSDQLHTGARHGLHILRSSRS